MPAGALAARAATASYGAMKGVGRKSACGSIVSVRVAAAAPGAAVTSTVAAVPETCAFSVESWPLKLASIVNSSGFHDAS